MMIAMEDYFGRHEEGLMSAEQVYQAPSSILTQR
jgi:hypothetical protein